MPCSDGARKADVVAVERGVGVDQHRVVVILIAGRSDRARVDDRRTVGVCGQAAEYVGAADSAIERRRSVAARVDRERVRFTG